MVHWRSDSKMSPNIHGTSFDLCEDRDYPPRSQYPKVREHAKRDLLGMASKSLLQQPLPSADFPW